MGLKIMGSNPKRKIRKNPKDNEQAISDFIKKYGVASGGDWGRMFMSAIKNGMPNVHAKLSNTKSYSPVEMWNIIEKNLPKQNPGMRYHNLQRLIGLRNASKSVSDIDKHHWLGYSKAHNESYKLSKELKMNPQARAYVGITHQTKPKLFTSTTKPSHVKFGRQYMMIHGPFKSYTDAEKFEDRLRKKHKMNPCKKNPILGKLTSDNLVAIDKANKLGAKQIRQGLSIIKAIFIKETSAAEFGKWLNNHKHPYQVYKKENKFWVSFKNRI